MNELEMVGVDYEQEARNEEKEKLVDKYTEEAVDWLSYEKIYVTNTELLYLRNCAKQAVSEWKKALDNQGSEGVLPSNLGMDIVERWARELYDVDIPLANKLDTNQVDDFFGKFWALVRSKREHGKQNELL